MDKALKRMRERLDEAVKDYNIENGHAEILRSASNVLCKEYQNNEDFRKATIASVESALKDAFNVLMIGNVLETSECKTIARKVADRIYGSD